MWKCIFLIILLCFSYFAFIIVEKDTTQDYIAKNKELIAKLTADEQMISSQNTKIKGLQEQLKNNAKSSH